jgi:hypothetical protein
MLASAERSSAVWGTCVWGLKDMVLIRSFCFLSGGRCRYFAAVMRHFVVTHHAAKTGGFLPKFSNYVNL